MDKFALRCFNSFSNDREISGVQVASTLLQLPTFYTVNDKFISIDLWWLRRYIRAAIHAQSPSNDGTSLPTDEEPCRYEAGEPEPVSVFDNYKWRGGPLASLSLYEYTMLVQTRHQRNARFDDVSFDASHPRSGTLTQHLARNHSVLATVAFVGHLTEFQVEEDSVPGGHPRTDAIMEDMAEILLGLFVPWEDLTPLVLRYATLFNPSVWAAVEPTLPAHLRDFARNVELLRKSREDCQLDAKLRSTLNQVADDFDRDVDELDQTGFESDDEGDPSLTDHIADVNVETLIAAYHSIRNTWQQETLISAQRIPSLIRGSTLTQKNQLSNLRPVEASSLHTSGLQSFPPSTLDSPVVSYYMCVHGQKYMLTESWGEGHGERGRVI